MEWSQHLLWFCVLKKTIMTYGQEKSAGVEYCRFSTGQRQVGRIGVNV